MTASFGIKARKASNQADGHSDQTVQANGHVENDFLAMLSHELRTPLNSIMGMLQLALHSRNRDSIQEYLNIALESSKHMLLLLGDISEIVDSDAAPLQASQEAFELEGVISPIITSFSTSAGSKGLHVACRLDPKLPKHFLGDPRRVRQILFNLLAHAVKQTERGNVTMLVRPLAEHDDQMRHGLHIQITSVHAHAGKASGQRKADVSHDGTDLRLSIIRHLVNLLGGELVFAPQEGKVSDVQVLLPLQLRKDAQQGMPAGKRKGKTETHVSAVKVLVVEDEPINLKTMLLSLQLLGCTSVGADSAYKGLALLRKEAFDVVLMDIQMPGLDGLEATRLIRGDTTGAVNADIPIVAITAHALQGDKERILKAGMNEYLAKPVYLEQLQAVLSKVLKRPLQLKHT